MFFLSYNVLQLQWWLFTTKSVNTCVCFNSKRETDIYHLPNFLCMLYWNYPKEIFFSCLGAKSHKQFALKHTFLITTALTQTQTAHLSLCVLGRCDRLIWILLAEKCAWPKTEPVLWNIALNIAGILSNDMWIVCSFIWILIPFRCACGGWRQYVLGCASLLYFHFICTLIFQKGREGIFFFNKTSNIHFNLSVRSIRILWFICLYTINHIVEIHCVISEASFGTLSCRPYCKF